MERIREIAGKNKVDVNSDGDCTIHCINLEEATRVSNALTDSGINAAPYHKSVTGSEAVVLVRAD